MFATCTHGSYMPKLENMQTPQTIKHGKDGKDNLMHSLSSIRALSEGRPIMLDMAPAHDLIAR